MNARAPQPLRILLAWPEPAATELWRVLQALRPQVDVTRASAAELADHLQVACYYHVLHVTPDQWRALPPRQRGRLAGRVCLVILGPGPAATDDAAGIPSCLYAPVETSEAEGVALFQAMHQVLAEGWHLAEIVANSRGRLALAGGEPAWPAPAAPAEVDTQNPPAHGRAVNVVDAQGGAVALGPSAKAINVGAGGSYIEQQTVTTGSGIAIGSIVVRGDMVAGDKVVHHAAGDQINVNRGAPPAGKTEQNAGGDQVNINRMSTTPPAGAPKPRTCSKCGELVEPEHRFCLHCGTPL